MIASISLGKAVHIHLDILYGQFHLHLSAYGVVFRAKEHRSSKIVALKQVRIPPEDRQNGVPITALREISILRLLKHDNIVNVLDVAVGGPMDEVYMVMEYCEQDMATLLDELGVKFTMSQTVEYLHKNDITHRDVKMQNILLTAKGVLKLADFGMARAYSVRPLTPGVVTIWYRSPELLLGTKNYTSAVDIWSAGLVLAELLQSEPCLTGETPVDQLALIVKLLGSPSPEDMAALSAMGCPDLIRWRRESLASGRADNIERRFLTNSTEETVNVLRGLLTWNPQARWTATEALGRGKSSFAVSGERWWKESPRATDKELLPTYPEIRNGLSLKSLQHRGRENDLRASQADLGGAKAKGSFKLEDCPSGAPAKVTYLKVTNPPASLQRYISVHVTGVPDGLPIEWDLCFHHLLRTLTTAVSTINVRVSLKASPEDTDKFTHHDPPKRLHWSFGNLRGLYALSIFIVIPRWISWDSETPSGQRIHYTYGLHRRCSSLTGTCEYFPQARDCHGDRYFCSMWRSVGFLMSFAVVMEGMTLITFIVVLAGGKQKREQGWKVMSALLVLAGLIQCAGSAIIAFLYDNDDRFFPGWKLDFSWVLCTTSWSILVILAGGIVASAFLLPSEGGYELIPDTEREE
ncbi:MAG: hypothetical protein Q9172_005238 [Xanthocarpia lactea]